MLRAASRNVFQSAVSLLKAIGIDRAIGFTVIGRVWHSVTWVVSLLFVTWFLSPQEQGYYYTFGSLLALQVFVELGLTNVVMQFASHERAHLELTPRGTLTGSPRAKARLASLLWLALKWYGVAAVVFAVGLTCAGFVFFTRCGQSMAEVGWRLPWIGTVLATAGGLVVMPVLALLEGCGCVADVARFRFLQATAANVAIWAALVGGAGLGAAAAFAVTNLAAAVLWLATSRRALLADLLRTARQDAIDWRNEIWPYQWRIGVSWLCGYFIFQLFTPLSFAFLGPVEAGRIGMAMTMVGAIASVGISWLSTKAPRFGALVARGQFRDLDKIFFRSLKQAVGVTTLGAACGVASVSLLNAAGHAFAGRILAPWPMTLLTLSVIVNVVVTAEAIYLRAFKREPFLPVSVLNAVFVGASTYLSARFFGPTQMMLGYLIVNLVVGLGLGTWIFRQNRFLWHKDTAACA